MLTLADLGILRDVEESDGAVVATITPTYSGCPAMREISADLKHRLHAAGYDDVEVRTRLAPAWTTDWITDAGRAALSAAGIAPPGPVAGSVSLDLAVRCPQCGSLETRELSRFSSTACKALRVCTSCREPFDQVKPL